MNSNHLQASTLRNQLYTVYNHCSNSVHSYINLATAHTKIFSYSPESVNFLYKYMTNFHFTDKSENKFDMWVNMVCPSLNLYDGAHTYV